ncbi:TetR family transcriptional regulator [Jannaschia sp. R86511]|uniref:TetR family transcriptional regulator n=1 Tax=Jannaschia sp. R86511 TaxID=3093853 RepID=UPI0036D3861D
MSKGRYTSALRAEQAAETRRRVLAAAAERFAEEGFARTTLAKLAETAGVSVETVQAQGPKRGLLTAAVHQLSFGGPDEDFFSAPQARATREAATAAEFCRHGAELVATFNAQTFRLWRAFASAAADDPAVERDLNELSRMIRGQSRRIVAMLAEREWLRHDVEVDELADSLWVLIGSENYDRVVTRLGWTHQSYIAWMARSLADLLLRR